MLCVSGRIVAAAWWLGALIIVQSYTANLAAFLTIKSSGEDISSVEGLSLQNAIQYGTVLDSQVQVYFDISQKSPYEYVLTFSVIDLLVCFRWTLKECDQL